jgi:hypothetical protein
MKRKHIAVQFPLRLHGKHGAEAFKLEFQTAVDHERLSLEQQARELARQESARKQQSLFE